MSDSVLLPVPTTSPPHVTEWSYRTAIRWRAMKLPRRSDEASLSGPKKPSTIAGISTSSDGVPRRRTTSSASCCDAGDDVRYGIRTQSSLSAPIASATRNATSAESMPPESPSTARSKPACRSCPRMNSSMIRRATSVSIASSVGSSNAAGAVIRPSSRWRAGTRSGAA